MKDLKPKTSAVIRFAGDSGDGMQLIGSEWVKSCAKSQNDIATMPDFPAEIRAPQGTLAGVSGFQIQFASTTTYTAGDKPQVLVALNPAALKANIGDVIKGGTLIINSASFSEIALVKAGYENNPLEDQSLSDFNLILIDMNTLLRKALDKIDISTRDIQKCKNFFCLGLLFWLYKRDPKEQEQFIKEKFKHVSEIKKANLTAFKAGFLYGENTETIVQPGDVLKAPLEKGHYRVITGNKALSLGLIVGANKANLSLCYASYPITPASDILHELAALRNFGANVMQVEDEMAAICAAIGASYGGAIGITATSGPGFALKAEALGYATMVELPLIVIDVQRAGPSTGMPTKTEQADLLQAIYGRSGESPLPVLAARSPEHCFDIAITAMRIAVQFMTPVVILSDASIASCSSLWNVVDPDDISPIKARHEPLSLPFKPYERDPIYLSRSWVLPGTEGLIHQLGGLEKDQNTGKVSYDAHNHQAMINLRAQKIERVKDHVKAFEIFGDHEGDLLLAGFGGTFGPIRQATIDLMHEGLKVSHLHIELLNPLDEKLALYLKAFKHIVVVEHNLGQLKMLLRAKFLVDAQGINKVMGKPFLVEEIMNSVKKLLEPKSGECV